MKVWLDAQLSPMIVTWINENFNVSCTSVRELGFINATDLKIFNEAKNADAIVQPKI